MYLSDQDFIHQFEQKTLPLDEFNHRGHLRLAWLYLQKYSLQLAIKKITKGIEAFAVSLGANDKFHHTLTEAIVRIMYRRCQKGEVKTFEKFLQTNPDLVNNIIDLVHIYYSNDRLNSEIAKREFVFPDIKSF